MTTATTATTINATTQHRLRQGAVWLLLGLCVAWQAMGAEDPKVTVRLSVPAILHVAPAAVTLTADAQSRQKEHPIVRVEFYQGATLIGSATQAPYTFVWTNVAAGRYSLTAKAYNDKGDKKDKEDKNDKNDKNDDSAVSAAVLLVVDAPPTVALTAPTANQVVTAPGTLTVSANAADSDGSIAKVEFYQGSTLIGTATASPYSFVWGNISAGSYSITAKATDDRGASTTSAAVQVIVNAPPTLALTAPTVGQKFTAPASIVLAVTAADADGSVVKVDYFQNGNPIGSATAAPFGYTWANVPQGSYTLTAQATDDRGTQTTSAPVAVTVNAAGPALGIYFIHPDHLGTPRLITDSQQNTVWRWDNQEPFGNNPPNEDPNNTGTNFVFNPRFPGQYADRETNLNYNLNRDYDPGTGRYIQSDPIGLQGGINTYAYVGGNPVSFVDPRGLDAVVVLYPGASGFGHVGVGVNANQTQGLYPAPGSSEFNVAIGAPNKGALLADTRTPIETITVPLSPAQDQILADYLRDVEASPGNYSLGSKNCATTVAGGLRAVGLNPPNSIRPSALMNYLRHLYY